MTTAITDVIAPEGDHVSDACVRTRVSFRFSTNGLRAACFAGEDHGSLQLEAWSFRGRATRWWPLPLARPVTVADQSLPLDDGRILLCRNRSGSDHEITLIEQDERAARERVLAVVHTQGCSLVPRVGRQGQRLGIAITFDGARSTIWRLSADAPHLVRLAELGGLLDGGGVWLDRAGTLLGVDRVEDGGPAKAVAVDLRDGAVTPLLDVTEASNDRLLAGHPRSGLLLVSTDARGAQRLGWGCLGAREPVRFPGTLQHLDQAVQPLAFGPEGQRVLLAFDEGVHSRLAIYAPARDRLTPVEIPPGCARGPACWVGKVLRFPFSDPSQPPGVATVGLDGQAAWSLAGQAPSARGWAGAHVEQLEGAAGPVEAIIYGGQGWRASSRLLLALHGGPVDAWRYEFEPFFQRLAAAGIGVVALNQRGSSGYGTAHTLAIRGAWGGPDLDDIRCVARTLCAQRRAVGVPRPMLCGSSYGAFLALLAASSEPDLWSHCVALAPFLSGPRLYREATAEVRRLIEELGGLHELRDDLGPRDVLRLCPALRATLLVVHGDRDEVIPVSQSRALQQRLLELGRREGVDFDYLEVPGGRHDLLARVTTGVLCERLVRFLLARPGGLDNNGQGRR